MSWRDFQELVEKANSYRNRVKPKRLKHDMGEYGVGSAKGSKRAQKGSPFKNVSVSFKGKGFNDISGPSLEEAEESSFIPHDELQPDIWQDEQLNSEVQERLLEIVNDFVEGLDIELDIEDIRLTGSLANYNWSKYSDIDLHFLVDFSKINENVELVKAFFDQARMRWNDLHRILVHGFEVEIYVEDANEDHRSSGLYSLLQNEWLKFPPRERGDIDFATADKKAQDYKDRLDCVANEVMDNRKDYKQALRCIERIKEKIRDMRKAGLESEEAEFSAENIAFKILRRDGVLERLSELKYEAYDKLMTLREE